MMKTFKVLAIGAALACLAFGQAVATSTTLSSAITSTSSQAQFCLASATSVLTPSLPSGQVGSTLMVDREAAQITGAGSSTTCFKTKRGVLGTPTQLHASGAVVWVLGPTVSTGDPSRPTSASTFFSGVGAAPQYSAYNNFRTFDTSVSPASVSGVAGTIWQSQLFVPYSALITGACVLNGATVGTNKWILALYSHDGTLLANTAVAGTTTAGASQFQCIAFTSPIAVIGPRSYYVAAQMNGTTDNFLAYATGAAPSSYGTTSVTGTFGTLPSITPAVTFTASKGPVMSLY